MKNKNPTSKISSLIACSSLALVPLYGATTVFEDDFSSSLYTNLSNPNLGGGAGNELVFATWTGGGQVTILNGALTALPTSSIRTAVIAFDNTTLTASGEYSFNFDISEFIANTAGNSVPTPDSAAYVSIWKATGYDTSGDNRININTEANTIIDGPIITETGTATASQLKEETYTAAATAQSVTFNYDGTGAIFMLIGAQTGNYPFSSASFDNISVTSIPEPSSAFLGITLLAGLCCRRSRS
ncbi:hypothetical protein [Luteolibacter sp. AS25]|uniref:hypothetical protein n=1 Tax=Luteolibacter sp. AS25 TaxID=3135776 RepID=UPI00398B7379